MRQFALGIAIGLVVGLAAGAAAGVPGWFAGGSAIRGTPDWLRQGYAAGVNDTAVVIDDMLDHAPIMGQAATILHEAVNCLRNRAANHTLREFTGWAGTAWTKPETLAAAQMLGRACK